MRICVADSKAACLEEPQATPSALLLNSWTSRRLYWPMAKEESATSPRRTES